MRLFLVRHGETAFNRDGVGLGRSDVPLTARGQAQAAAVGRAMAGERLDIVLTSPLRRARETAEAVAAGSKAPLRSHDGLLELDVGETEGLAFTVVRERFPDLLTRWAGPDGHAVVMPGGESLLAVNERVQALLAELQASSFERVALVSHNFVIRMLVTDLLGLGPSGFRRFTIDLASISVVDWTPDRTFVRKINDCCHLESVES